MIERSIECRLIEFDILIDVVWKGAVEMSNRRF